MLLTEPRRLGEIDLSRALVVSSPIRVSLPGKTGPIPRIGQLGNKHKLNVDAQDVPLALIRRGANCHDITQLDALVKAISDIQGKRGAFCTNRESFGATGVTTPCHIGRVCVSAASHCACEKSARFTAVVWANALVNRALDFPASFVWTVQHSLRALRSAHEAFMSLACTFICWTYLKPVFDYFRNSV